jgi:hypothetical protein
VFTQERTFSMPAAADINKMTVDESFMALGYDREND